MSVIIIDGPDGTGKSTLAKALAKRTNGEVIHSSWNKNWDIKKYHCAKFNYAVELQDIGITPVLDRWAASENIYAKVFRDGESYDTNELIQEVDDNYEITWIFCRNDNAAENHLKHMQRREEMWDDMNLVAEEFDKYIKKSSVDWWIYDYDKVDINEFVKEIT